MDDGGVNQKAKGTKKCIIKRRLKFEDYKKGLENNQIILRSKQTFKRSLRNRVL